MSGVALGLVLAAAVAHALWNRLFHETGDRLAVLAVSAYVAALLLLPALVLRPPGTLPVTAWSSPGTDWSGWPPSVWLVAAASGLAEAVYGVLLAAAYARGALAVTYPVGRGTAPLLVTLGAWVVLDQEPSLPAAAGAVALAVGLVVVGGAARGLGQLRAVGWAVAVGVAIATYSVLDAFAVRRLAEADAAAPSPFTAAGYLCVVLLLSGLVVTSAAVRSASRLRASLRPGAVVALGVVTAYLLVLLAFQRADAGRVATLRESSVLLAVALTRGRRPRSAWLGAALVVLGAVLVAT